MSRLMQMPELYIRGAMATQTMPSLTLEQRDEVERIVDMIAADQALRPDRTEFINQLGNTIQGDYRSDKEVAKHEFYIAIWRATVYLLYHRSYSYYCLLCGQAEYTTTNGKQKAFDRQYKVCPYCKKTILDGQDDQIVKLHHKTAGYYFIGDDGVEVDGVHPRRAKIEEQVRSPIKAIAGDKRIEDPYKILNDAEQRGKWYSVWIWNYFRQILNENIIHVHNKRETTIAGPATAMAAHEIMNGFKLIGRKFYFDESTIFNNELEILSSTIAQDEKWVAFFISLVRKYANYDVEITYTFFSIKITGIGEIPTIETTIMTSEPVVMFSLTTPSNNTDEDNSWSDILEANSTKKYEITDHDLDEEDTTNMMRKHLADDTARAIFDIYSQKGEAWAKFSDVHGHREAAKSHLAKYFGISVRQVDEYRQQMMDACLTYESELYGKRQEKLVSLDLEKGDYMVVLPIDGQIWAHNNMACKYIKMHVDSDDDQDSRYIGRVLYTKHKFIKIDGIDHLVTACPHCVER